MKKSRIKKFFIIIIATVIAYLFLVPILFMVFTSLKSLGEAMSSSALFPRAWTLENYTSVINDTANSPIFRWMLNTALITVLATVLVLAVDCMAAYSLARLNLPGKKIIVALIIWVMTVPGIVTLFPSFYLFKQLGLTNTYIPLILPYAANAMGVYLIYNFLKGFPKTLEEAAYIDGANTFGIFWHIVMPSIRPVLLTLGLLTFLTVYNDFLWPTLVVSKNEMKTLSTGIASLVLGSNFVNPGLMMAATLIAVLPALVIFILINKYLVRSNLNAGIK